MGPHFLCWIFGVLTRDLSQAEKKITVVTSWATEKWQLWPDSIGDSDASAASSGGN